MVLPRVFDISVALSLNGFLHTFFGVVFARSCPTFQLLSAQSPEISRNHWLFPNYRIEVVLFIPAIQLVRNCLFYRDPILPQTIQFPSHKEMYCQIHRNYPQRRILFLVDGIPFWLMKSRGGPPLVDEFQRQTPFGGLYVDEFLRRTPLVRGGGLYVDQFQRLTPFQGGCMLMNFRGVPPFGAVC